MPRLLVPTSAARLVVGAVTPLPLGFAGWLARSAPAGAATLATTVEGWPFAIVAQPGRLRAFYQLGDLGAIVDAELEPADEAAVRAALAAVILVETPAEPPATLASIWEGLEGGSGPAWEVEP